MSPYRALGASLRPWRRLTGAAAGLAAAALGMACAREEPPPGAHPDRTPPSVRQLTPDRNAIVPGFGGSAEVRFDEPITGTRNLQQTLVASPADRYEVSSGFSNIKIKPSEDWADGVVYYFKIPEGIADLLGNRTEAPVELVFSTGPELSATRVTGEVRRRVDGNAVSPGRVLFYNVAGDSIPYGAVTDRQGAFELPYLPPDDYWSFAFQDLNNNLRLERLFEAYDSVRLQLDDAASVMLAFQVVEPDTTPPVMGLIRSPDPLVLQLEFDDYLDPEQDLLASGIVLRQLESGNRWEVDEVLVEPGERARRPQRGGARAPAEDGARAPAEDAAGRTEEVGDPTEDVAGGAAPEPTAPDSMDAAAEGPALDVDASGDGPVLPLQEEPPAQKADTLLEEEKLPSQTLRMQLATPMEPGTYRLTLDRVINLRLLEAGVDTTFSYPLTQDDEGQEGGETQEGGTEQDAEGEPEQGDSSREPDTDGGG